MYTPKRRSPAKLKKGETCHHVSRRHSRSRSRRRVRKSPRKSPRRSSRMGFTQEERWEIYTMEGCGACANAKKTLLNRKRENPEISVHIENGVDNPKVAKKLEVMRTWPRIFLNGKLIGGNSDLETYLKTHK